MTGIRKPADGPSEVEIYNYKVIENFLKLCSRQKPLHTLLQRFSKSPRLRFNGLSENSPRWDIDEAEYDDRAIGYGEGFEGPWFQPKPGDEVMRRWVYKPQLDLDNSINCFMQENFGR